MLKKCFQGDPSQWLKSVLETSNSLDCLDPNHLFSLHWKGTYRRQHLISPTSNSRGTVVLEVHLEGDHRWQHGRFCVLSLLLGASCLFLSHILFHSSVPPLSTTEYHQGYHDLVRRNWKEWAVNYEPKRKIRGLLSPLTLNFFSAWYGLLKEAKTDFSHINWNNYLILWYLHSVGNFQQIFLPSYKTALGPKLGLVT